jgi:hypothetical protein
MRPYGKILLAGLKFYVFHQTQKCIHRTIQKRVGFREDIEEFKEIEGMEKIAKEESVERGKLIMSIAEKLREEGMEKGIEKGKLEERKEFTIKLLSKKFGIKLTEELKEKILKTDEKTINYIGDNLLEITLDELKEILK